MAKAASSSGRINTASSRNLFGKGGAVTGNGRMPTGSDAAGGGKVRTNGRMPEGDVSAQSFQGQQAIGPKEYMSGPDTHARAKGPNKNRVR